MILVLLGPPGVGKGTQAVRLADDAEILHLSTGDMLRAHRREGTPLGREAQAVMDRGELVSDEIILEMVRAELAGGALARGVVFDGFPRTVPQAEGLDRILSDLGAGLDGVVVLLADTETLVKRLSGRRSCPRCGAVYNVYYSPPDEDGLCDRCGSELVHRADDAPDTVRNRLAVYREETEPLVHYYDGHPAPVYTVDGAGTVDEVYDRIRSALSLDPERSTTP